VVFKDEKNQSKINVVKDEERKALLERGTLLYISSSPDPLFQPTLNIVYYFSRYYRYLQEKRAVNLDSENLIIVRKKGVLARGQNCQKSLETTRTIDL